MEQQNNLYIPVNIKTRFEFFNGFGFAELIPTVVSAIISGFIVFIINGIIGGGTSASVLIVLIATASSAVCLAKGVNNLSILDQIRQIIQFERGQKIYKYRRTDEWEGEY